MVTGTLPLNQRLEISAEEAMELWQQADLCPDIKNMPSEGCLSACGRWLLRRESADHYQHASIQRKIGAEPQRKIGAEALVEAAGGELARLQALGLNIISHGMVALADNQVMTITPRVEGLYKCLGNDFQRHTAPTIMNYYQEKTAAQLPRIYLTDVIYKRQYSKLVPAGEPFLHDVEPYVADDRQLLEGNLAYLSAQALRAV